MKPGSTVAGNTHDGILKWMGNGAFEGSILLPDGSFDRRRFLVDNDARRVRSAIKEWEQWKSEVRRAEREKMRARGRGERKARESAEAEPKRKEVDMTTAKTTKTAGKTQDDDVTYVVMVVGGAPIFVVEDFDHAASVCDALAAGAKASGFSAKYDVVEVKRWTV